MKDKAKKDALALVFGVVKRDNMLSGIPGYVPGLLQKLHCTSCEVKLVKGLPIQFIDYMSEEQKEQFKQLTGYNSRKKTTKKVVVDTPEQGTDEG